MLALGIDTSNYATSLAVVHTEKREVVCALKKPLPVPAGQLGLRQNEALFHHTAALPTLLDELKSKTPLQQISTVSASDRPRPTEGSYMPCFLAGVSFGSAFAAAGGRPLRRTTHQQGHLAAAMLGSGHETALLGSRLLFFHLSGGTTELLLAHRYQILRRLGASYDLYAGQAVDRLGVRFGFAFPAGEALSALALECGDEIDPKISVEGINCHLSGLENQCDALLKRGRPRAYAARYCLLAIAKTVAAMITAARRELGGLPALCAGGVMGSAVVRTYIEAHCEEIYFAPPALSGDNAVGVALAGIWEEN
jgi:N6-L-threonylcarbamoyladenine synthase